MHTLSVDLPSLLEEVISLSEQALRIGLLTPLAMALGVAQEEWYAACLGEAEASDTPQDDEESCKQLLLAESIKLDKLWTMLGMIARNLKTQAMHPRYRQVTTTSKGFKSFMASVPGHDSALLALGFVKPRSEVVWRDAAAAGRQVRCSTPISGSADMDRLAADILTGPLDDDRDDLSEAHSRAASGAFGGEQSRATSGAFGGEQSRAASGAGGRASDQAEPDGSDSESVGRTSPGGSALAEPAVSWRLGPRRWEWVLGEDVCCGGEEEAVIPAAAASTQLRVGDGAGAGASASEASRLLEAGKSKPRGVLWQTVTIGELSDTSGDSDDKDVADKADATMSLAAALSRSDWSSAAVSLMAVAEKGLGCIKRGQAPDWPEWGLLCRLVSPKSADDAGQSADDAGQSADDAGRSADDAGQSADDAGQSAGQSAAAPAAKEGMPLASPSHGGPSWLSQQSNAALEPAPAASDSGGSAVLETLIRVPNGITASVESQRVVGAASAGAGTDTSTEAGPVEAVCQATLTAPERGHLDGNSAALRAQASVVMQRPVKPWEQLGRDQQ
jgi:hypothetical protein